jgi:hypothetical protein
LFTAEFLDSADLACARFEQVARLEHRRREEPAVQFLVLGKGRCLAQEHEEHVLGDVFGEVSVARLAERDGENETRVPPDQFGERVGRVVRQVASKKLGVGGSRFVL